MRRLREQVRGRARRLPGQRGQRGQSVVELAIFMPLILIFSLVCIQFAVIFIAYVNVVNVTRDAARWVTIHPNVIDSSTVTTVKSRVAGGPTGLVANNLTITFSPACASLTSSKCAGRDAGARIQTTSSYTIASHLFLPTTFGWGSWQISIPQTLPDYTINMQVEPN
jgi:hypothetical protein